ncbi:hypothetical protein [Nonlabens antarcticus]|uniref:hypothetical protein n=1 Tax=Nonlabens antarcticus TaxID=392714 RepID=UPI001891C0AC|nr:hypothetical protein [Nonlabens antarcticus]
MNQVFTNSKSQMHNLIFILMLLIAGISINTITAQKLSTESSVLQNIENEKVLDGFQFGQQDIYSGISTEAKELVLRISKEFPDEFMVRNDNSMTGDEYELYIASIRNILINGATRFENDNGTLSLQVMELPNDRYLFIKTNQSENQQMNGSEFLAYIKGWVLATGEKFHKVELSENDDAKTTYKMVAKTKN